MCVGWSDAVQQLNKDETEWLKLPKSSKLAATSQRQLFESNPDGYLKTVFKLNNKSKWPQTIVGFGGTMDEVKGVLKKYGYTEKMRLWNCLLPADGNSECSLSVYER